MHTFELHDCPVCAGPISWQTVDFAIPVRPRESVTISRNAQKCLQCGESFFGPGEMDAVHRAAADIVRTREGLLAPEEIKALRESMHLSQAQLERLLRVGAKTVVRWERGTSFQNRATDTLLRVLRAVPQAREFLVEFASEPSAPIA